jgi:hypothetical protein
MYLITYAQQLHGSEKATGQQCACIDKAAARFRAQSLKRADKPGGQQIACHHVHRVRMLAVRIGHLRTW